MSELTKRIAALKKGYQRDPQDIYWHPPSVAFLTEFVEIMEAMAEALEEVRGVVGLGMPEGKLTA